MWVCTHNRGVPRVSEATKVEHRQRLLDAAAAEFAAKGLDGARIDDISVAAGLAKGTVYNYFDSKIDVFRAVIEEWSHRTDELRDPVPPDAPVADQLRAILEAEMQATVEMEEFARTAFREVLTAPRDVVARLLPAWDPLDAEVEAIVGRGQKNGELRTDRSAAELTRIYTTVINGMMLEHWMPDSDLGLDAIPDLVLDYYLEGVRAR